MFSFTVGVLPDALIAARERGVTVRIIVDKTQATGTGPEADSALDGELQLVSERRRAQP